MAIDNHINETNQFSLFNQSENFFENIYQSIKNIIHAGQHDIFKINGMIRIYFLT